MTIYLVTMAVEAKSENQALLEFERQILSGEFDREALEAEVFQDDELEDDEDFWEDDDE
jgi:hypothetical protein